MIRIFLWMAAGSFWMLLFAGLGFYVTFPQAPIQERVEYESVRFTDKQFAVAMESIRPWWIGLKGNDVTIYGLKKGRKTKDTPKPPYERREVMKLDSLAVRAEPLSFVLGKKAAAFAATLLGGAVDGRYSQGESAVDLSFEAADLDLSQIATGTADEVIHLLGVLAADADLHLDTADVKQSTGSLHLSVNGLGIGAGSKAGGFGLPEATFEKAVLTGEIQDGKIDITEGTFEGSVISATLTGDISLNKKISRSRNHLDLAFTLPEEYDQLAQLSPTLKRSKDDEGRYHCSVSGTFVSPSFRCGSRSGKSLDGGIGRSLGARGGEGLDDDTRRKEREARIAERRERLKKKREEAGLEDPRPMDEDPRRPFDIPNEDDLPPGAEMRFPEIEPPIDPPIDPLIDPADDRGPDEPRNDD